jgi:phosphatidate cytidylyltransferase
VALWIIFSGFVPGFLVLVSGLALLGLWEYYAMLDQRRLPNFKYIGMTCGALMIAGSFYTFGAVRAERGYDLEGVTLLGFLLIVFARQMFETTRDRAPLETMAYTVFGLFYVPWLFSFVTKLIFLFPRGADGLVTGHWYVLWLVVVTKFSDMGAYLTGSLIGKHPLIPHISPKKTWEGFFGALAFSAAGALGLVALMPEKLSFLAARSWWEVLLLGMGLGFAAIIGDLAESIIKRNCEVKDSGRMLPGIGGALDLIDSILFTAPLLFYYLRLVVGVK